MCHSTGSDVDPNVTEQRAVPRTGMGALLYGLSLTFEATIRSSRFQRLACTDPQTETRAPVSAMGVARLLSSHGSLLHYV